MNDWLVALLWGGVILAIAAVSPIGYLIGIAIQAYREGPEQGKQEAAKGPAEEPAGGWRPGEAYPSLSELPRAPHAERVRFHYTGKGVGPGGVLPGGMVESRQDGSWVPVDSEPWGYD